MPELKVDEKTLETIFDTEGWIEGEGKIASKPYLVDKTAFDVYHQDVVDAVRYIVQNNLVNKGKDILSSNNAARLITFEIELQSNHLNQGRYVPPLELQVIKCRDAYDGRKFIGTMYYGRLTYRKNPDEFIFAQFDIPQKKS